MPKSYKAEKRKLAIKVVKLNSQLAVARIREAIAKREREATTAHQFDNANVIALAYSWVSKQFGADIAPIDYLRAVEEITRKDFDTKGGKVAMLPVLSLNEAESKNDKEKWLFELNCQIEAFLSPDVELVWKKK